MGSWLSGGSTSVIVVGCVDNRIVNTGSRREIDTHESGAVASRFLYDLSRICIQASDKPTHDLRPKSKYYLD